MCHYLINHPLKSNINRYSKSRLPLVLRRASSNFSGSRNYCPHIQELLFGYHIYITFSTTSFNSHLNQATHSSVFIYVCLYICTLHATRATRVLQVVYLQYNGINSSPLTCSLSPYNNGIVFSGCVALVSF